jgi:hypothetical protein
MQKLKEAFDKVREGLNRIEEIISNQVVNKTPGRFIDNGDGTVTDTKTKLMWVKNPHTDLPNKFKKEMDWQDAIDACKELSFANHNDWRLPTREELFSLTDDTRREPAIDKEMFPDTKSSYYWTSTPYAGLSGFAWYVVFGYGSVGYCYEGSSNYVRAVRSSQ